MAIGLCHSKRAMRPFANRRDATVEQLIEQPKLEWVKPVVQKLDVGNAEGADRVTGDNGGLS